MNKRKTLSTVLIIVLVLPLLFAYSVPLIDEVVPLIICPGLDGIATVTDYNVLVAPSVIVEATTTFTDVVRLSCPERYTDQIGIANLTLNPNQIYEFQIFVTYQNETIILYHYRDGATVQNNTFTLYSETEAIMGISIMPTVTQVGLIDPITYEITCSYGARDIAIISVTASETQAYVGDLVDIVVVVRNKGTETETFNVTAYYGCNETTFGTIGTQTVTNLAPYGETNLTIVWNTTDVRPYARAPYTIRVEASVIPGETSTADNIYVDGKVNVKIQGDIDSNGIVDIVDIVIVAIAFGSALEDDPETPWDETLNWNPDADLNGDLKVDIVDIVMVAIRFGREETVIQVIDHVVVWEEYTFHVVTESDSVVSDFAFSQPDKMISFNVTGMCGTRGFCKVTIPNALLGGLYTVLIDGSEVGYVLTPTPTHSSLYFKFGFPPCTRKVQIIGATVIS